MNAPVPFVLHVLAPRLVEFHEQYMAGVAKMPVDQIVSRIEAVSERKGLPDQQEAVALLGATEPQRITVTRALELYFGLWTLRSQSFSTNHLTRFAAGGIRASRQKNVDIIGDLVVEDIRPEDMQDFQDW